MEPTRDLAGALRDTSLTLAVRSLTGLFAIGSLLTVPQLVMGNEPMAFLSPFAVFLFSAAAWWFLEHGRAGLARGFVTGISLLYIAAVMGFAGIAVVMAIGFPLTFMLLLMLHLVHRSRAATQLGWAVFGVVGVGCVRLVSQADVAEDWPMLVGACAQALVVAVANGVLWRFGTGWERALEVADDAHGQIAFAYEVALDASRAKSQFLASMSHELRTPLNAIIGYTELIEDDLAEGIAPDPEDLGRIERSGRHLLDLVNQVLDLSRVEAGHITLDLEAVDLAGVAREVADTLKPQLAAHHNQLVLHSDEGLPPLLLDGLRTKQVITNLLANAAKFTESGTITVSVLHAGGDVELAVSDTGRGIAPEEMERIFEPFLQADGSIQRSHGGTGLGLAISKRLVREMGGVLAVQSQLGHGARFSIRFPVPAAA